MKQSPLAGTAHAVNHEGHGRPGCPADLGLHSRVPKLDHPSNPYEPCPSLPDVLGLEGRSEYALSHVAPPPSSVIYSSFHHRHGSR